MLMSKFNYNLAKDTRTFVKNVANDISKGKRVDEAIMSDYNILKEEVKFSKNPIKNFFNFLATLRQVKKEVAEILQAQNLKTVVPEGGNKPTFTKQV